MHLFDLPDELLVLCCEQTDMFAARALRQTCKRIAPMANKRLFSHVHLLPTTESANKARAILENKDLMPLVTTISIKASLDDSDPDRTCFWSLPDWRADDPEYANEADHGIETNGILSETFKKMLRDIGLFKNLRRVELKFDWEVIGESSFNSGHHKEWTEYREPFLRKLFAALNHPKHPAAKLHSLCIYNLHDLSNYNTLKSDDFKAVISRLETLELAIATEDQDAAPESNIECPERHCFFGKDLIEFWLAPTQQNLVNLKLYSNCYWGYLPRCDFRPLHFPKLKSLAFGNMTFTHDSQLEWIASHGQTLESLTLDDCPIVHDAMICDQELDTERYVKLQDDYTMQSADAEATWTYPTRWHDYFTTLTTALPKLQHFGIGHGPWNGFVGEDTVSKPFEAAAQLPARLEAARYVIFHGGTGPSQWIEPGASRERDENGLPVKVVDFKGQYDSCWDEDDDPPPPTYPDCWEKDQEALDALVAAVERRRGGRGRG